MFSYCILCPIQFLYCSNCIKCGLERMRLDELIGFRLERSCCSQVVLYKLPVSSFRSRSRTHVIKDQIGFLLPFEVVILNGVRDKVFKLSNTEARPSLENTKQGYVLVRLKANERYWADKSLIISIGCIWVVVLTSQSFI